MLRHREDLWIPCQRKSRDSRILGFQLRWNSQTKKSKPGILKFRDFCLERNSQMEKHIWFYFVKNYFQKKCLIMKRNGWMAFIGGIKPNRKCRDQGSILATSQVIHTHSWRVTGLKHDEDQLGFLGRHRRVEGECETLILRLKFLLFCMDEGLIVSEDVT